jgi:uncharacterized protein (DUF1800 family)
MKLRDQGLTSWASAAQAAIAASLCAAMVMPPALLAQAASQPQLAPAPAPRKVTLPEEAHPGSLSQQQRVLHALNRLTFGPRPGEAAAVEKMGLEAWFQRQLHPASIDDAAFEAELAKFPAMQLTQAQLMERFPSPQELRQIEARGEFLPSDPAEHAIYADALATYKQKLKAQAAGPQLQPAASVQGASMQDAAMQSPDAPSKGKGKKSIDPMDSSAVEAVLDLSPDQRYQRLVSMQPAQMLAFRAALKPNERVALMEGLTPTQMETVAAMQGPERVVAAEAMETRLLRDVSSDRQLQAVMTDFWLNHFSVYVRKNQNEPYYLASYQRDTILPNALGSFEKLLVATASSPAMMMYLDNWESVGPDSMAAQRAKNIQQLRPNGKIAKNLPQGINENYARELMELHTLGVNGGYTQQDVIQVARCFTGWTIDRRPGEYDKVVFDDAKHEGGSKTVLGHVIPEGGVKEGLEVLHILATSPATARFISTKLAVRFVSDDPPPSLVDKMAATFLRTNGDISAVLSTMFHAPEFWSPAVYRAKAKTPLEFMTSAVRASGATVQNPVVLVQVMQRLGMPVYGMQTPNGYSWKADEWVSSNALVARMNFSLVLSGDRVPGIRPNWPALLGNDAQADSATERRLELLILGQPAAARTRATVLEQATNANAQQQAEAGFRALPAEEDDAAATGAGLLVRANYGKKNGGRDGLTQPGPETPLDTMAGLMLGSPDFQRR